MDARDITLYQAGLPEVRLHQGADTRRASCQLRGHINRGGLAEAAYYEILGKHTPILVVDDQVTEGAIAIMARLNELAGNGAKV